MALAQSQSALQQVAAAAAQQKAHLAALCVAEEHERCSFGLDWDAEVMVLKEVDAIVERVQQQVDEGGEALARGKGEAELFESLTRALNKLDAQADRAAAGQERRNRQPSTREHSSSRGGHAPPRQQAGNGEQQRAEGGVDAPRGAPGAGLAGAVGGILRASAQGVRNGGKLVGKTLDSALGMPQAVVKAVAGFPRAVVSGVAPAPRAFKRFSGRALHTAGYAATAPVRAAVALPRALARGTKHAASEAGGWVARPPGLYLACVCAAAATSTLTANVTDVFGIGVVAPLVAPHGVIVYLRERREGDPKGSFFAQPKPKAKPVSTSGGASKAKAAGGTPNLYASSHPSAKPAASAGKAPVYASPPAQASGTAQGKVVHVSKISGADLAALGMG